MKLGMSLRWEGDLLIPRRWQGDSSCHGESMEVYIGCNKKIVRNNLVGIVKLISMLFSIPLDFLH